MRSSIWARPANDDGFRADYGLAASSLARSNTPSSISGVSLPVNVFCWLGWKQPSRTNGPARTSAPWPNLERGRGAGCRGRRALERAHHPVPGEAAERHEHPEPWEEPQLSDQERQARVAFLGGRAVAGGAQRYDGGHIHVRQREPVVARGGRGPVGQPRPVQRAEQEIARAVAREDAARAVPSVRGRARDPRSRSRARGSPKPGHGLPQYRSFGERRALLGSNALTPGDQPGAPPARFDLLAPAPRGRRRRHHHRWHAAQDATETGRRGRNPACELPRPWYDRYVSG